LEEEKNWFIFQFQIEDKVILKTFLRWVRRLGEVIQWMISAIQEVPW